MRIFRRAESAAGKALQVLGAFLLITFIVGIALGIANSNLFWGEANQNGRVRIPGTKVLHLPAGDVQVNVAIALPGRGNETPTLPLPRDLSLKVTSVDKAGSPTITRDVGTSENASDDQVDTQETVYRLNVPSDGDYKVVAGGNFVSIGPNAQFWFGHEPGFLHGWNIWLAAMAVAVVGELVWLLIDRLRDRNEVTSPA